METKLAVLYQELAQIIDSMIPCDWSQIYYLGEVEKGRQSCGSVFYFSSTDSDNYWRSFEIPKNFGVSEKVFDDLWGELVDVLLEIYDCFIENDQQPWEQFCLSLSNTGKFNIEFNYDVMHDNDGGSLRREVGWAYETFGLEPTEGYLKEVFEEYVANKDKQP